MVTKKAPAPARVSEDEVLALAARIAKEVVAGAAHDAEEVLEVANVKASAVVANRGWHVGKEIPLTVIGIFLAQTFAVGWFVSQLSGKVDNLVLSNIQYAAERYTKDDARRDLALADQKLATAVIERNGKFVATDAALDSVSRRVDRLERGKK